ncbi:MAG: hypothetical protein GY733_23600 [bacterium]|nr:hypothetical protein [bacterium]
MKSTISKLRLTSLLVAFAFVAGLAATASATVHPLNGNGRFQIGDGLPIPATFQAAPNGRVLPVTGAVVSQTGTDPMALKFQGSELKAAVVPFMIPVLATNGVVFQVKTSLGVSYPDGAYTLSSGGRTGASVVSFCPGSAVTPTGNPGCASAAAGGGPFKGLMIYTKTSNQFGGAMTGRIYGGADVAIRGSFTMASPTMGLGTGFKINMALANANTSGTGAAGNAFGGNGVTASPAPPSGMLTGTVNFPAGTIVSIATTNPSAGVPNPATSYGAPWTTGQVVVSETLALAGTEMFTLTGADSRVSGVGSISLVAGGLSNRAVSGPNANRGWLNLSIGSPLGSLPSMSGPGIAALVGLMSLAGGYAMRQRRK